MTKYPKEKPLPNGLRELIGTFPWILALYFHDINFREVVFERLGLAFEQCTITMGRDDRENGEALEGSTAASKIPRWNAYLMYNILQELVGSKRSDDQTELSRKIWKMDTRSEAGCSIEIRSNRF